MEDSQTHNFIVKSSIKDYDIIFDSIKNIEIREDDLIIIDDNIDIKFDNELRIRSHESCKEYSYIFNIINDIVDKKFKRNNRIIAIGGGVIQDITGFISSILFRGVEWIFYPTTLLSQGDSCIGAKTSINVGEIKNLVGNFYPPIKVVIDIDFIDTLPKIQLMSGIGEMCHYFLIDGRDSYEYFKNNYMDKLMILDIIHKSLSIKKKMIELDEFDKKERKIFNYGHSFGHAIESITNYDVPHGIAVCHGMSISNYVSMKLNYLSEIEYNEMEDLLKDIYTCVPLPKFDIDDYIELLKKDKKNIGEDLGLILTKGFGNMFLEQVSVNKVYKFIKEKI